MSVVEIKNGRPGALEPGRVEALGELITVQDGAVVSRELKRTSGGTVTLFAFDGGQGLSEHTAPFDALVHVVDGELDVVIGGEQVRAGTGEIVLMPANVPHALHAPRAARMLLIMLRHKES